jgi:hypothetical protein
MVNTKKAIKSEDAIVNQEPVAAKPLSKAASVKAVVAKPVKPVPVPAPASEPAAAKIVKEVKVVKEPKVAKKPKPKVVRDSFTMPQSEYQKISEIKEIGLKAGLQVKKSEVLRAGVIALCAMNDEQLNKALSSLDKIKTGRPNKH